MSRILIFSLLLISSAATAMEIDKPIKTVKKNVCCHYCRVSDNRVRKGKIEYLPCSNPYCKVQYCGGKTCQIQRLLMTENGCSVCQKTCCCAFEFCPKRHVHCYTYNRTLKRHQAPVKKRKILKVHQLENTLTQAPLMQIDLPAQNDMEIVNAIILDINELEDSATKALAGWGNRRNLSRSH